nr:GerAB/ArcD/ProY family transporter [Risungbinella massiliensis]
MENTKMTLSQFFHLIIIFELGTSVVIGLGLEAKQDAWISILLALLGGITLFGVYTTLFKQYPTQPITSYIRRILGNYLGWPISLLYLIYFLYISARVLMDTTTLLRIAWLDKTPTLVIIGVLIIASMYLLFHGIQCLSKTGVFFNFIYLAGIILALFALA